jgi:hypothetical protein
MNDCGAINKTSTISWGSPMIILITNNLNFDIYDLEIREIIPPRENLTAFY